MCYQSEICELERTRESMARELVDLSNKKDELADRLSTMGDLKKQYDVGYDAFFLIFNNILNSILNFSRQINKGKYAYNLIKIIVLVYARYSGAHE